MVAALVGVEARPAEATWTASFRGLAPGATLYDGTVAEGRVWRLGLADGGLDEPSRHLLFSRSVDERDTNRIELDIDDLTPPPPPPVPLGETFTGGFSTDSYGVRDGNVVVLGGWQVLTDSPDGPAPLSSVATLASFDGRTGKLLEQRQLPTVVAPNGSTGNIPILLAVGNPATVSPNSAAGDSSLLMVPFTLEPLEARYPTTGRFLAGDRVLGFPDGEGHEGWARGDGPAEVADLVSGEKRYTVPRYRLLRATRGGEDAEPRIDLSFDGLAQTEVEVRRARRLVPVAVDTRGTPGRVGRSIPNLARVRAMRGHGRAFVYVAGNRTVRGKRRDCSGLWITNVAGTRGRRLALGDSPTDRQGLPDAWDGRAGVWFGRDSRDRTGVHVDTALHRLKLRRSDLPRCP